MVESFFFEYSQFKDQGNHESNGWIKPSRVGFAIFVSRIHQGTCGPDRLPSSATKKITIATFSTASSVTHHQSSTETANVALMLSKTFRIGNAFRISSSSSSPSLRKQERHLFEMNCMKLHTSLNKKYHWYTSHVSAISSWDTRTEGKLCPQAA